MPYFFRKHGTYLSRRLLDAGCEPQAMPNLSGEAGKRWFRRWQKHFGVVSRKTVPHLNVPRETNKRAWRFLWHRCFGEARAMSWVSKDQKPLWYNNTALDATYSARGYDPQVEEIEAHSR